MRKKIIIGVVAVALVLLAVWWRWSPSMRGAGSELERFAGQFTIIENDSNAIAQAMGSERRPVIVVSRQHRTFEMRKDGGYGWSGRTGMRIHVAIPGTSDWMPGIINQMNQSPQEARNILGHSDLRVRLLVLAALQQNSQIAGAPPLFGIKSHVWTVLGESLGRAEPYWAASVLRVMQDAGIVDLDALAGGLSHYDPCVRSGAAELINRRSEMLDRLQLQRAARELVGHLDDHHAVVRGDMYNSLVMVVRRLEHALGGTKFSEEGPFPVSYVKLPPLPPKPILLLPNASWKEAIQVQDRWKEWIDQVDRDQTPTASAPDRV